MISRIKSVSVPVSNQERAVAFYTETLGFTVAVNLPFHETQRWIELQIPGGETRVVLFASEEQENRRDSLPYIIFTTYDIEATCAELVQRGVNFIKPLTKESWGSAAIFSDPDGNRFVLSSSE
jgi:predicted enzyme related to lactoylglutathione lyase